MYNIGGVNDFAYINYKKGYTLLSAVRFEQKSRCGLSSKQFRTVIVAY